MDKPFARIGTHPDGEIVLDEPQLPARCCYLHGTEEGIFCYALTPDDSPLSIPTGWMSSRAILRIGQTVIRVRFADSLSVPKPDEPDLRLNRAGYGEEVCLQIRSDDAAIGAAQRYCHNPLTLVGRRKPSLLRLKHETISKTHCVFYCRDNSLWVVDLLSANGTLLEGKPIECAQVLPGQTIELGAARLSIGAAQPDAVSSQPMTVGTTGVDELSDSESSATEPSITEASASEPSVVESTEFFERDSEFTSADENTPLGEQTLMLADQEHPDQVPAQSDAAQSDAVEPDVVQHDVVQQDVVQPELPKIESAPEPDLQSRCQELEQSLAEATARAQTDLAALQQRLDSAEQVARSREEELNRQLVVAQDRLARHFEESDRIQLQVTLLQSQLAAVQEQLAAADSERDRLQDQAETAAIAAQQNDAERKQLQEQLAAASQECGRLQSAADAAAAELAESRERQQQAEAIAQQRQAELQQSDERLRDLQAQLQQQAQQAEQDQQRLRAEQDQLAGEHAAMTALLATREAAMAQLQAEVQQGGERLAELSAKHQQQLQTISHRTEERDRYQAEVAGVQRRLTDLIRRAADAEQQSQRGQENLYQAQRQIDELQQALAAAAHSDTDSAKQTPAMEQRQLEAETALEAAQQQIGVLQDQLKQVKRRARRKIRQLEKQRPPRDVAAEQAPAATMPTHRPATEQESPIQQRLEPPKQQPPLALPVAANSEVEDAPTNDVAQDDHFPAFDESPAAVESASLKDAPDEEAVDPGAFELAPPAGTTSAESETRVATTPGPAFDIQASPRVTVGRARQRTAAGDDDFTNRLLVYHQKQSALARRKKLIWTMVALLVILILGGVLWSIDWSAIGQMLADMTA